jgi:hypothetical protein
MKNNKVSLLIIGHGRHGKDSLGELICKELPELTFTSSSWFFAEEMFNNQGGSTFYSSVQECFDDRANYRELWRDKMVEYNTPNPSRLAQNILATSNLYIGMRTLREYEASKKLFNFIFYVDASERVKYVDPTFEIKYNPKEMIFIDNNLDLENLKHQAKIAADLITGRAYVCK